MPLVVDLTAHKDYRAHGVRALLEFSDFDVAMSQNDDVATLDRVWFQQIETRNGRPIPSSGPLPLGEVPSVAFSEAMRDVDLFVGVARVGTHVNWEEWEIHRVEALERYEWMQAGTAASGQR